MKLNIQKKFIYSFFTVFCTVFSMEKKPTSDHFSLPEITLKSPFIERLKRLRKNNPPVFSFLGGLGAQYIFKKAAHNIYKKIIFPVTTWTLLHTCFLLAINKDRKNIRKILIPWDLESLTERENYFDQKFSCFPFISVAKKIIHQNKETIKDNISDIFEKAKQNSLLAAWASFGFMSPVFYKKLENYFVKKILWYLILQESFTLSAFLTNQENRTKDAIKEYVIDHANPKAEIDFYGSTIKINPLLNFGIDIINTIFFKQNHINKQLHEFFFKNEIKSSMDKENIYNEEPTRQSFIKKIRN